MAHFVPVPLVYWSALAQDERRAAKMNEKSWLTAINLR
jgi:hypothetical protein